MANVIKSFRFNPHLSVALGFFAVLGVLVYFSPQDNNLHETTNEAIERGYKYAYYVLEGDNENTDRVLIGTSQSKPHHAPIPSLRDALAATTELERLQLPRAIRESFSSDFERDEDRLRLIMLERRSNFYVLTFSVLRNSYLNESIQRDGEPMVITVAIRYFRKDRGRWIQTLGRKVANLWVLPLSIRKLGSLGDWYLVNYQYTYNLREYFDWGIKNAERMKNEAEAAKLRFSEDVKSGAFAAKLAKSSKEAQASLEKIYDWSEDAMDLQLDKVTSAFAQSESDVVP